MPAILLDLNEGLFERDPQLTKLGVQIIKNSIDLIEEIGFEAFTFKKLASKIGSTEASIYRYFKNKHLLLLYLHSWYWAWLNYLIELRTQNLKTSEEKLQQAISIIADSKDGAHAPEHINVQRLHHMLITEGSKVYHTRDVDSENKEKLFFEYKKLANYLTVLFQELKPNFPFPRVLASTMLEMANEQVFFSEHLPALTDVKIKGADYSSLEEALSYFVQKILE